MASCLEKWSVPEMDGQFTYMNGDPVRKWYGERGAEVSGDPALKLALILWFSTSSPSSLCQMPSWVVGHGSYLYFSSLRVQHLHQNCLFVCLYFPLFGPPASVRVGLAPCGFVPRKGLAANGKQVVLVQNSHTLNHTRTASIEYLSCEGIASKHGLLIPDVSESIPSPCL